MLGNRLFAKWDRLDKRSLKRAQAEKLRVFLRDQVVPFSPFYRELFRQASVDPDKIRSLDDLQWIPFTSKQDLLPTPENPNRARDFVLIPDRARLAKRPAIVIQTVLKGKAHVQAALQREYRPIFLTSTTGRSTDPVTFLYTAYDLATFSSAGKRFAEVLGIIPDDHLVNMFPFAPHLAFWQVHYAATAFGVFTVSTGGGKVMGTDGNLRLLGKLPVTTMLGMPTFLYHVLRQAVDEGRKFENLTSLVLGGEKVPPGMRTKLAALVKTVSGNEARILATYGFTEAKMGWGECPFPLDDTTSGYHLYPDLGLFEVIDPESGKVLPDGSPGELVFTPLDARGSVVLRYRTGDFIDGGLSYEPCPYCGRTTPRLLGNISRQSEVKELRLEKIKGTLVDFNILEHVLDDAENIGAWQIELRKAQDDPLERDELILHVEKTGSVEQDTLALQLTNHVAARTEVRPNQIVFHNRLEMSRRLGVGVELKEKRVVDHRPQAGRSAPPADSSIWQRLLGSIFKHRGMKT